MKDSTTFDSVKAQQALLLLVPAASIGVAMATYVSPGIIGQACFTLTKIWLVILPIYWRFIWEKKVIKIPKITFKQINLGLILGLIMSAIIIAAYWFIGLKYLNITEIRTQATAVGITKVSIYFLAVMYWSFINSLIEECVWRGFVYRQCRIWQSKLMAIVTSALFFTLHHIIGLFFYLQNPLLAIVSSFGVFTAGVIWSFCYQRSGFWVCYISHILADLAIGLVGWHLLFSQL
jgi:membrane protease YdiL (CAAX protease family)